MCLNLPAFLRGQAASHFHAIPSAQRASYADAIAALKQAMCPATHHENFYAEFESRTLRSGEDPAVYRWKLGNLLSKADPILSPDATTALISRQYMSSLCLKIEIVSAQPHLNPGTNAQFYTALPCSRGLRFADCALFDEFHPEYCLHNE